MGSYARLFEPGYGESGSTEPTGVAKPKTDEDVETVKKGLTTSQAAEGAAKWGKNEIPEEKEPVRHQT